jgi:hypothetical protein
VGFVGRRVLVYLNRIYWWVALYALLLLFVLGRRVEFPEVW